MKRNSLFIIVLLISMLGSCRKENIINELTDMSDYSDWGDATHSNNVDPDYAVVFDQNQVLRFDIKIDSENWSTMQNDLADNLGSGGVPGGGPGGVPGGGPGDGPIGGPEGTNFDPVWVTCSFKFENKEWYNVGVRFKGNSSLRSVYQSGNNKFSFKLDFDEFEDDFPALKNQRFYGFKQLNLNSNYNDASLMREKIVSDLFRQFGLASAHTAFCVLYIDKGEGPQYYGVYALVEEIDDTVLGNQFADGSGNLYKPEGNAATFAYGTYNTNELELKTNEDSANYSDIRALYDVINRSERTSDTQAWKTNLESVFNVDGFLKWLAANTVFQNWDTYGIMNHNYYLYNNPENGLLTWIPWDNNEALHEGKERGILSLSLNEAGENWPLIRYLIDQPEYEATYEAYLKKCIDEVFIPSEMISKYSNYYELIKEYAYAEESRYSFIRSDAEFDQAVETLKTHVQSRNYAVHYYLE